jgi:hypothetical protein
VRRDVLLTAFALLSSLTSLFGQNSRSEANRTPARAATSEEDGEHRTYVSGFEVVNGGKDLKDLGYYPS